MHLYLATRGIRYDVQKFIDTLYSNMMPYPHDKGEGRVQLVARPIQLWEVVFPKACLPNVLKGINYNGNRKDISLQSAALRKVLGAKKIPKLDLEKVNPILAWTQNVGIYPIGIKEDKGIWKEGVFKGGEKL